MTNKLSDKDKKDWQNFIDSSKKLESKEIDQTIESRISKRTIDLHGYTLEEANKEISKFIENCYLNKVKKKMKVEVLRFFYQMGKYLIKLESINQPFQEFSLNNLGQKY